MPALRTVGVLTITGSPSLRSLAGLESAQRVAGDLTLTDLGLTSLQGLAGLQTIDAELHLEALPYLRDLRGLEQLTTLDRLEIHGSEGGPASLVGLDRLAIATGSVEIVDDGELTSLEGLDALTSIGFDLVIRGNARLESLNGLNASLVVAHSVLLDNLPRLVSLEGFPALEQSGAVRVHATGVTTLAGLESLQLIDTSLVVDANPALTSLAGLDALTEIDHGLEITDNPVLVDLAGGSLGVIHGGVLIRRNASLGDDTANAWLTNIALVTGRVDIAGNGP